MNIRKQAYQEIKKCMEQVIRDYYDESAKLEKNIYFMNGNDSNQFDWEANERTSEFFVYYDTKEQMGFCKLYYTKDNKIKGYTWNNKGNGEGHKIEFDTKLNAEQVSEELTKYHDIFGSDRFDSVVATIE